MFRTIIGPAINVSEKQLSVATYQVDENVEWSIVGGNDSGKFEINKDTDGNGVLTFKDAPILNTPTDSDANNVYNVTIEAQMMIITQVIFR